MICRASWAHRLRWSCNASSEPSQSRASAARNCCAICIGAERSLYRTRRRSPGSAVTRPASASRTRCLADRLPRDRQAIGQVRGHGGTARRQRGNDGALTRVGQGDEDLYGDRLDVRRHRRSRPVHPARSPNPECGCRTPCGRRLPATERSRFRPRSAIVAWLPNQLPRPSAVVSAAHTLAGKRAISTTHSMRSGNPTTASNSCVNVRALWSLRRGHECNSGSWTDLARRSHAG